MKTINWRDHLLNFVSVILGVSLAFYVGSSSQRGYEKRELKKILQSMVGELESDIAIYEQGSLLRNKEQSETITEVLELIRTDNEDSLSIKLRRSFNYTNYYPQKATYNSASSSGKLDLIEDFELRKQITVFYLVWGVEAEFKGRNQIEFHKSKIIPWVLDNTDLQSTKVELAAVKNRKMVNMLIMYKDLIDSKVRHYEKVVREAKELKANLEVYMN